MDIAEGLNYRKFRYADSTVHLLTVDLRKREVRPVLAAEEFPFLRIYPVKRAIAEGALSAVGGGFNTTWYHHTGVADEPLHALIVGGEVWTTGIGAGGYGLQLFPNGLAYMGQNHLQTHVWRPDGTTIEISHINHGHDGKVVAFTSRGGTNEYAIPGKNYALLGVAETAQIHADRVTYGMTVLDVRAMDVIPMPTEDCVILEAHWPMRLAIGDEVKWVQRPSATHLVSGWPGMISDGVNVVPLLNLDPQSPHGPDNWFVRRNPRMALGVSEDHRTVFICTVEGRISSSKGLRLKALANMLRHHGVWDAVNMDGGGSAFMWTLPGGLVAPGCYNTSHTLDGLRPDHYSMAVF